MRAHRKIQKRRLFGASIAAALCAGVFLGLAASASAVLPTYSNGFETDTAGWIDFGGTIARQPSGYDGNTSVLPYADNIASASGSYHARLGRGTCGTETGGGGDTVNCPGPFTRWGGYNNTWTGGYTTQVDIYLDTAYAQQNPDSYGGNIACLTASGGSTDTGCKGTRFDYASAINKAGGGHLRDFGFNVSTGPSVTGCTGFTITGQTNVNRTGANPNIGEHDPQCVDTSGWYTFKHTFSDNGGNLRVLMQIIPVGSATPTASWTIDSGDPISTVGCNRYGWFSDQEIYGLPIDNASMTGCGTPPTPPTADIGVTKFYDANANGTKDGGESDITGWQVAISDGLSFTPVTGTTPLTQTVPAPGSYTVSESSPTQANWVHTTPPSAPTSVAVGDTKNVAFGNVCIGAGGGLSKGFWGNKNGQALFASSDLTLLDSLNLRNANGSNFDPTSYSQFKNWLSKATATNMAYMLSAQLAAMELSVAHNKVSGSALVYAPGTASANSAGFASVSDLMAEANTELGAHGLVLSGSPYRAYQSALKNALESADTNQSFVQAVPCAFTFAP